MIFDYKHKSYPIGKDAVWGAFKKVRSNGGSYGVDKLSLDVVSANARKYLYPVWNRMASGSYFPQAVKRVYIPKRNGSGEKRGLGIPTVQDRVAQMVIREELEQIADNQFSASSYGYRPNKSAHDAVQACKENCQKYDWVIDLDIKSFFDEIDHDLMMQALGYFTDKRHIHLYVRRWLECCVQEPDGSIQKREKGTPQGGVISPLLANIFLHIVFDKWMELHYPEVKFERYADDIVIHCKDFKPALRLLEAIKERFRKCKLRIKSGKSNIVYCQRSQKYHPPFKVEYVSFDFLGFTFRPRTVKGWLGRYHLGFTPAISCGSAKRMVQELYKMKIHRMVHFGLTDIASILEAKIRGWIHYYGKFRLSEMRYLFRSVNRRLVKWVINKYRRFRRNPKRFAYKWLRDFAKHYPTTFVHWQYGFFP